MFFNKKKSLKEKGKIIEKDLGLIEDTWGMLVDMIAYEDHCFNDGDLESLNWMRKIRTYYLDMIGKECSGNKWCRIKHLCRIGKGLQEDCSRFLSIEDLDKSKKCFEDYQEVYGEFIKLIGGENGISNETKSSA